MNRTIIPGPPGTGKTYHLINHYLNNEINNLKTDTKRIAYITFSNAATQEARKRIFKTFPGYDFPYINTMHSLGTRQLNIDTNSRLLQGSKWKAFKNYSSICRDMTFDTYITENGMPKHKNRHMKIIDYSRAKKVSLEDAMIELDLTHQVNIWLTEQIEADLESYKKQTGMVEYSDMIKEFVKKDKCPPLDVVFLDEAQDLNPLQWDMFFYIESKCKRSYLAGDDDQTIYTFQGADENIFINLKGKFDPRIESRRVPKLVHQEALKILEHINPRLDKDWNPRNAEGKIFYDQDIDNINFKEDNWMVIARTNPMLTPIKEHLISLGLRFDSKINDLLPIQLLEAYKVWIRLNNKETVTGEEAKLIYEYLNYDLKHTKRGFSSGDSLNNVEFVDIDTLTMDHGLQIRGDWQQLHIPEASKLYIKTLLDNGEDLFKPARIKVSTIHGVKGEECKNVVLYTDLEKIIYDAALKNPNPEHRLFFVGVTRTKENLYIMRPTLDYYYTIGDPIL